MTKAKKAPPKKPAKKAAAKDSAKNNSHPNGTHTKAGKRLVNVALQGRCSMTTASKSKRSRRPARAR